MYSLSEYYREIESLETEDIAVDIIGYSTLMRPIYMASAGDPRYGTILVHGGIHAREYITAALIVRLMRAYKGKARIVAIPLVNVDGAELVQRGLESIEDRVRRDWLYHVNGESYDFRLWKANANAVDLNVNYDAGWSHGDSNIRVPASANYIGRFPLSEVENLILAGRTLEYSPDLTLSYHTKGEVIFEGYEGIVPRHDIATMAADYLGYPLMESHGSYGGYKDWFVKTTGRLGLTIEVGSDSLEHPIGMEHLDELVDRHIGLLDMLSDIIEHEDRRDDERRVHENGDRRGEAWRHPR